MIFLLGLLNLILPLILIFYYFRLFFAKRRKGLIPAGITFLLLFGLKLWTLLQSTSSTAAIGFAFLHYEATICAILTWVFLNYKNASQKRLRTVAWIMLVVNAFLISESLKSSYQQRMKTQNRKELQSKRDNEIKENRAFIHAKIAENKGRENEWLNREIAIREKDELFLIPALETQFVWPENLEKLSQSEFTGVVHMVTRNPLTAADTLAAIYAKNLTNGYFNQALAAHKNTPVRILRELYSHTQPNLQQQKWLAENPSTPKDILLNLAKSQEVIVLHNLLNNSKIDCAIVELASNTLNRNDLVDTFKYLERTRALANDLKIVKCRQN